MIFCQIEFHDSRKYQYWTLNIDNNVSFNNNDIILFQNYYLKKKHIEYQDSITYITVVSDLAGVALSEEYMEVVKHFPTF